MMLDSAAESGVLSLTGALRVCIVQKNTGKKGYLTILSVDLRDWSPQYER